MTDIKKHLSRLVLLFTLLFSFQVFGQEATNEFDKLTHKQLKRFAGNAVRIGDTYSAIRYYERYVELKPEKYDALFQLAELYRASRDYKKAEAAYIKAYNGDQEGNALGLFYYAQMLKANGEYEKAKEYFVKFNVSKGSKNVENAKEIKKLGKTEILGCDVAKELIGKPLNLVVDHLDTSINKAHRELSPVFVDDKTMIYSSLGRDSVGMYKMEEIDSIPVIKFFVANRLNGNWLKGKELEGPFNKAGINTGNGSFSPDGNRFYFTRCGKNKTNRITCKIFVSQKVDGTWTEPVDLGEGVNSDDYTSTMPTVGDDSKKKVEVVYFVSDREGGKGGMDIWYTFYDPKSKTYKEAKNIGTRINTPGDEITPNYDMESRTLYFSSNGHPNIGGLDIFSVSGELKSWGSIENIGYPVNSSADDLYYAPGKGKENGFLVSNRKGGVYYRHETCCDDIYEYKHLNYIHIALTGNVFEIKDTSNIKFLDDQVEMNQLEETTGFDKTGTPISKMVVSLFLIDKENGEVFLKSDTTKADGKFFFTLEQGKKYKVLANSEEFFRKKLEVSTVEITRSDTLVRHIGVKAIPKEPIIVKNIYYDFDKADLKEGAKTTIDTTLMIILNENPSIIVEISSHTDSKGADDYNKKLSQKRAESVVKYLQESGIAKDRLVAKGYGEEKPIAKNENPDGSDNPDGRQMNRRTEFRIIGFLKDVEINYEE